MARTRVAIVFGGRSEEHDVSVKSAIEIAANLDPEAYEARFIGITRTGAWKACAGPSADWERGSLHRAVISPDRERHGLLVEDGGTYRHVPIDVVFPVLHGRGG